MKNISLLICVVFLLAIAFLVVPVAGEATQIAVNAGNSQSATAGTAVTTLPSVIVKDATDAPVSGVAVTFTIATGGGSGTGLSATTGVDGIATVGSWTLGTTAGTNTLTATSGSLTGSPVTFTATGTAGAATQIAVNAGNSQSATVDTAVTTPPSVIVKDVNNNPVSGVAVTFAVATGGGSGTGLSATTGSNGIATVGSWTLGPTAGSNALTAASGSLTGSPVTFTATGTTTTIPPPVISSLSPTNAANSGSQTIEIVGTGFNVSTATLTKTGQSTVPSTITGTDTALTISRIFNLNGIAPGTWNLVILNSDGGSVTGTFTVNNATAASVTSISPTSGTVNTSVSTTISGTGFVVSSAKIRLYKSGNYIGGSVNSGGSSTLLTGTFNLNQATIGSYDVCVLPDGTDASKICGPTFTINSAASTANGSINVRSTPSISKVFLNTVYQGYTPMTLENITPGTYTVMVRSAGFNEWSESVKVTAGNISYVTASLVLAPDETTVTTAPKTTVATVKTTAKSTAKVPTPWPSATATPASPVSVLSILGAVGVGIIVLRKW